MRGLTAVQPGRTFSAEKPLHVDGANLCCHAFGDVTAVNMRNIDDHRTANTASSRQISTQADTARSRARRRSGRLAGDHVGDDHRQRRPPDAELALGASTRGLQWIVDAYNLPSPHWSWLGGNAGDKFGCRGTLIAGPMLLALSMSQRRCVPPRTRLIIARLVMGVAAALIYPDHLGDHHRYLPRPGSSAPSRSGFGCGHRPGVAIGPDPRRCVVGGLLVGQPVSRAGADRPGRRRGGLLIFRPHRLTAVRGWTVAGLFPVVMPGRWSTRDHRSAGTRLDSLTTPGRVRDGGCRDWFLWGTSAGRPADRRHAVRQPEVQRGQARQ